MNTYLIALYLTRGGKVQTRNRPGSVVSIFFSIIQIQPVYKPHIILVIRFIPKPAGQTHSHSNQASRPYFIPHRAELFFFFFLNGFRV